MVTEELVAQWGLPEILDVYYLESIEQLQAISDPTRYQLIVMMDCQPMTGAQLARALNIPRARAHYHLKLLEKVGLVKLWGEDASSGIKEKYYCAVGRMLDFTHLVRGGQKELKPGDLSLQYLQAVNQFLVTLLEVSKGSILKAERPDSVASGFYFDFAGALAPDQIEHVRHQLGAVKDEIIAMTRENKQNGTGRKPPRVRFRSTLFLTLLSDASTATPEGDDSDSQAGPTTPA
jgi:DNA-binding transcriptional ArsR family regulator